jgi:hypothetical protein
MYGNVEWLFLKWGEWTVPNQWAQSLNYARKISSKVLYIFSILNNTISVKTLQILGIYISCCAFTAIQKKKKCLPDHITQKPY